MLLSDALWRKCAVFSVVCAAAISPPGILKSQSSVSDDEINEKQAELFEQLGLLEAWETTKGSPDVVVGIIDTGFDFFHPELKGQLLPGFYAPGGYHTEFFQNLAHGTQVASLIAAKHDGQDMSGLAPGCRVVTASQGMLEHTLIQLQRELTLLHPKATPAEIQRELAKHEDELRAFGGKWVSYQVRATAQSIRYLVDRDVQVINVSSLLSRGLCHDEKAWDELEAAFADAAKSDIVIVLGAGNNSVEINDYPGKDNDVADSIIIVGACLSDGRRWATETRIGETTIKQGSNFGDRLGVMAPVENLMVCRPHDQAVYSRANTPMGAASVPFSGPFAIVPNGATSSATPIVTSLVALVRSARPDLDAAAVVQIVKDGCDDLRSPGRDDETGHGRVNFARSMLLACERDKQ